MRVNTWPKFSKYVRSKGCHLLDRLDEYDDAVLVTGCQRSGTTILSRVITQSKGMVRFQIGKDDELDAALILSGMVQHHETGRYCFQTTYVNECYEEYFRCGNNFKLIWVLRSPHSVIYSMLYHWKRFALNELFQSVGVPFINESRRKSYERFSCLGVRKIYRACAAYNGKLSQLPVILESLGAGRVFVVDYSNLIHSPRETLKNVCQFIDLEYEDKCADMIHGKSASKEKKLTEKEKRIITTECAAAYETCKQYLTGA